MQNAKKLSAPTVLGDFVALEGLDTITVKFEGEGQDELSLAGLLAELLFRLVCAWKLERKDRTMLREYVSEEGFSWV